MDRIKMTDKDKEIIKSGLDCLVEESFLSDNESERLKSLIEDLAK